MKIILHIPTEQFGFVAVEADSSEVVGGADSVAETYKMYSDAFKPKEGMMDKEVDTWLDNMFLEKGNSTDVWAKRSPEQEKWLKCIKRSLARIATKQK